MKNYNLFILIFLFIVSCGESQVKTAQSDLRDSKNVTTEEQRNSITNYLNVFPNKTNVAFALIENGAIRFFGVTRENDTLVTVENYNSVFEIGSISKVFTSTLLANFVLDGKVKLDDKINTYIKVPIKDNAQISFKELANHTSGLPRMPSNFTMGALFSPGNPYKYYDEAKLEEYLTNELKFISKPGEKSQYSNLGAGILSYTLGKVSGKDYQSLLAANIFSKYKMTNSTTNREEIASRLVKGLDAGGNEASNWDLGALVGAGGILSTVEDLSKFALAQFEPNNKELELTRTKTHLDSAGMDVGLGWHIVKPKSGNELYWHNGGTGGYTSSMTLDIERKNGVIILSNISAFNNNSRSIDKLGFALLKTLKQD